MIHPTAKVHPTAIVEEGARIDENVQIGPFTIVGADVSIGAQTQVGPHAVIEGWTTIGRGNRIFQFASVGAVSQDLKYRGEQTWLHIGDGNTIREFATLHIGTRDGGGKTVVGNHNLFMAYSHVAHDCLVGDRNILANGATLAGHVEVGDHAILGGLSAVHQFCRIGSQVMVSGGSMVAQDVPPFVIVQGDRAKAVGLNLVGLKRRGFSPETIKAIKEAYRQVFRSGRRQEEVLAQLAQQFAAVSEVQEFVRFIRSSERGIAR